MSLHHISSKRNRSSLRPGAAPLRLQGHTLMLARGVWIAGAVAVLVIFFASLPANFAYLHVVRATGISLGYGQLGQVTSDGLRQLQALGLSVDFYATYIIVGRVIFVMVWFVVGGFIFWRKSDERIALFASFTLVTFPIGFSGTITVEALPPAWRLPVQCVQFLSGMSLSLFFYVFPDGRFVPRWTRWLLIGWAIEESSVTFFGLAPLSSLVRTLVDGFLFIGLLGSFVAVQVYRYRRVSTQVQRQQTKWVVFGTAVAVLGFAASIIVGTLFVPVDAQSGPLATMIGNTVLDLFLLLIPFSIGLAILHSRLWEIDVLINRTLVYGTLTIILTAVYVGLVIGLQALLRGVISQDSSVAIVISTLAIFNLVQPLRHRLQRVIDRRFYRSKYDATKIIKAFSATLRQEVDLNTLSEQLLGVVQETMQPTFVSLWLRPTQHEGERSAWGAHPLSARHTEEPVHE